MLKATRQPPPGFRPERAIVCGKAKQILNGFGSGKLIFQKIALNFRRLEDAHSDCLILYRPGYYAHHEPTNHLDTEV